MNTERTTRPEVEDYPPCNRTCPILTSAREYIQQIAERNYSEAFAVIRRQNPLPGVCGRICTHPCETACQRGQADEPISIAALKRFSSDGPWKANYSAVTSGHSAGQRVAVVGSGPAGLAAAHDLALLGYAVTIFEALPFLGGMLRQGVPAYRLPRDVLDEEIQAILDLGVEVKTGLPIGKDVHVEDLLEQGFQAVFLAIGAHRDRKLNIPGEGGLQGVVSAVSFLRAVNAGSPPPVGKRAAVIGGGNTAIDSARSLLRVGCETVHLVYRRSEDEMPAAREEIEEAVHEGVVPSYLTSPLEILGGDGKVSGLKCIRNELGEPDESGRRSPKTVAGSEFVLDVEMVITAIGQAPESARLADEVETGEKTGWIATKDPHSLATSRPGIFAGGDAVTGPATVIAAIAAGKRVARSIDRYVRGETRAVAESLKTKEPEKVSGPVIDRTRTFSRHRPGSLSLEGRCAGFEEVVSALSEEQAIEEALRCLHCRLGAKVDLEKCVSCLTCVRVCPLGIPKAGKMGEITIDPADCQACGMCALECPVRAIGIRLDARGSILQQVTESLRKASRPGPVILGFFDLHGKFTAGDLERLEAEYPGLVPLTVFGLRRIDVHHVLKALELGADAVLLAPCPSERDPFPETRERVRRGAAQAMILAEALGLGKDRVSICDMPAQGLVDAAHISGLIQKIEEMGPSPLQERG
jgi:NADPH-dependent glutamate synthase beta subunit-like oxidoreductase/ferredoxin/coenzyme F420-reducing hydrogenase delta subunit